jgi:hypothetical protein
MARIAFSDDRGIFTSGHSARKGVQQGSSVTISHGMTADNPCRSALSYRVQLSLDGAIGKFLCVCASVRTTSGPRRATQFRQPASVTSTERECVGPRPRDSS